MGSDLNLLVNVTKTEPLGPLFTNIHYSKYICNFICTDSK